MRFLQRVAGWAGLALGIGIRHLEGDRSGVPAPGYPKELFEVVWRSDQDTFGTPPFKGVPRHVHLGEGPRVDPGLAGNVSGFPSRSWKELLLERRPGTPC